MRRSPDTKRLLDALDIMKKEKGITVYKIAKKIGYAPQSFSRIRAGGQNMPLKWIHKLCETYGINKYWVFSGELPIFVLGGPGKKNVINPVVRLPIFDTGINAGMKKTLAEHIVDPNYFISIPAFKDCTLAYKISGDSMLPRFRNGDIVVCKKLKDKNAVLNGEPYVVITPELSLVRYIEPHKTDPGKIMLRNENEKLGAMPMNKKDVLSIYQVMGKVAIG